MFSLGKISFSLADLKVNILTQEILKKINKIDIKLKTFYNEPLKLKNLSKKTIN